MAQKVLADELTLLFHGEVNLKRCNDAASALFNGDFKSLDAQMLKEIFVDVPAGEYSKNQLNSSEVNLIEFLPQTTLC